MILSWSHSQLEHSSRHSLHHTINVDAVQPLGLEDLQVSILIAPQNFRDVSPSRYREEREVSRQGTNHPSSFLCVRAVAAEEVMSDFLLNFSFLPFQ